MALGIVELRAADRVVGATRTWRRDGQRKVTIIAKASLRMVPDGRMEVTEPEAIRREETHYDDHPMASVSHVSDLAPYIPGVDVMFVGGAHAVEPEGTTGLTVRMAVMRDQKVLINKALVVVGNRRREIGKELGPSAVFTRMPLRYERALGGIGNPQNPLGVGLSPGPDGRINLPNILNPKDSGQPEPAGFAPISITWAARKKLLGGTPRSQIDRAEAEIPKSLDDKFFHAAPMDQRIAHLYGDEMVMLKHLTPNVPAMMSTLPGVVAHAQAALGSAAPVVVPMMLDTMVIDGDAGICSLVWRGHVGVADDCAVRAAVGLSVGDEVPKLHDLLSVPTAPLPPARRFGGPGAGHTVPLGGTMLLDHPADPPGAAANSAMANNAATANRTAVKGTMILEAPGASEPPPAPPPRPPPPPPPPRPAPSAPPPPAAPRPFARARHAEPRHALDQTLDIAAADVPAPSLPFDRGAAQARSPSVKPLAKSQEEAAPIGAPWEAPAPRTPIQKQGGFVGTMLIEDEKQSPPRTDPMNEDDTAPISEPPVAVRPERKPEETTMRLAEEPVTAPLQRQLVTPDAVAQDQATAPLGQNIIAPDAVPIPGPDPARPAEPVSKPPPPAPSAPPAAPVAPRAQPNVKASLYKKFQKKPS